MVQLSATTNGNLRGNATFKFDVVTGNFGFVDAGSSGNTILAKRDRQTSDHNGKITAGDLRVPAGTPTQIGLFRVTDVGTGASTTYAFTIQGASTTPYAHRDPGELHVHAARLRSMRNGLGHVLRVRRLAHVPSREQRSECPGDADHLERATGTIHGDREQPANVCSPRRPVVVTDSVGQRVRR